MKQPADFLDRIGKFADLALQDGREDDYVSARQVGARIVTEINKWFPRDQVGLVKRIGSGQFSCVFNNPFDKSRVIKLGMMPHDGVMPVDGWAEFAALTMMMPSNPYLPKIYSIRMFDSCYVADMEKLTSVDNSITTDGHASAYISALQSAVTREWWWEKSVDRLFNNYPDTDKEGFAYHVKLFRTIGIPNDLHTGNIMRRGNTLIVTDPFMTRGSIKTKINLSSYAIKVNGVSIINAETLSNGQQRVPTVYYSPSSPRWRTLAEAQALWPKSLDAVQQEPLGLQGLLSSLRPEPIPEGTNITTRLQKAA